MTRVLQYASVSTVSAILPLRMGQMEQHGPDETLFSLGCVHLLSHAELLLGVRRKPLACELLHLAQARKCALGSAGCAKNRTFANLPSSRRQAAA
jgi:hypothetical protein